MRRGNNKVYGFVMWFCWDGALQQRLTTQTHGDPLIMFQPAVVIAAAHAQPKAPSVIAQSRYKDEIDLICRNKGTTLIRLQNTEGMPDRRSVGTKLPQLHLPTGTHTGQDDPLALLQQRGKQTGGVRLRTGTPKEKQGVRLFDLRKREKGGKQGIVLRGTLGFRECGQPITKPLA